MQNNNTVVVTTYRYLWKEKGNEKICVKYITGQDSEHKAFMESIKANDSIDSCMREYINEVNFAYLGYTEEVKKQEKKEIVNNEEN